MKMSSPRLAIRPSARIAAAPLTAALGFALLLPIAACWNATTASAETGSLTMQFVFDGVAPVPEKVVPNKDIDFCGKFPLVEESLLVDNVTLGIRNVIVCAYKLDDDLVDAAKNQTRVLANEGCRFEPRIVCAQVGDTLKVTNPDTVGHNANISFFKNKEANPMIPAGGAVEIQLTEEEPAPIPVVCNIHPWMKAYVVVNEHSFAGVSGEDGTLTITGLPAGEEIEFRVYHELGKIADVIVDGKPATWKRSRFDVKIKAGENNLGTVIVPASAFEK